MSYEVDIYKSNVKFNKESNIEITAVLLQIVFELLINNWSKNYLFTVFS